MSTEPTPCFHCGGYGTYQDDEKGDGHDCDYCEGTGIEPAPPASVDGAPPAVQSAPLTPEGFICPVCHADRRFVPHSAACEVALASTPSPGRAADGPRARVADGDALDVGSRGGGPMDPPSTTAQAVKQAIPSAAAQTPPPPPPPPPPPEGIDGLTIDDFRIIVEHITGKRVSMGHAEWALALMKSMPSPKPEITDAMGARWAALRVDHDAAIARAEGAEKTLAEDRERMYELHASLNQKRVDAEHALAAAEVQAGALRTLLCRYVAHVHDCEGVDFLDRDGLDTDWTRADGAEVRATISPAPGGSSGEAG